MIIDRTSESWEAACQTINADSLVSKFLEAKRQDDFDSVAWYVAECMEAERPVDSMHALLALGYWPEFKSHALSLLDAIEAGIDLREGSLVA